MDLVEGVIAGYGAIVATGALTWEVLRWRSDRKVRLKVRLRSVPPTDNGWVIWIEVINLSSFPVRVTSIRILQVQVGPQHEGRTSRSVKANDLPGEIPARDSRTAEVTSEDFLATLLDTSVPLAVAVTVATGETVVEGPHRLGEGFPLPTEHATRPRPPSIPGSNVGASDR
jgi:hypothetical protein